MFLEYTDRASSENVCVTNEGLFFDFVLSKGNLIGHLISNGPIFVFRSLMNSALSFSGQSSTLYGFMQLLEPISSHSNRLRPLPRCRRLLT